MRASFVLADVWEAVTPSDYELYADLAFGPAQVFREAARKLHMNKNIAWRQFWWGPTSRFIAQ